MDLRQAIQAPFGKGGAVARNLVPRRQRECYHRQGKLFPPRRRLVDARQEEPDAAGFEIFQANTEGMTFRDLFTSPGGLPQAAFVWYEIFEKSSYLPMSRARASARAGDPAPEVPCRA